MTITCTAEQKQALINDVSQPETFCPLSTKIACHGTCQDDCITCFENNVNWNINKAIDTPIISCTEHELKYLHPATLQNTGAMSKIKINKLS